MQLIIFLCLNINIVLILVGASLQLIIGFILLGAPALFNPMTLGAIIVMFLLKIARQAATHVHERMFEEMKKQKYTSDDLKSLDTDFQDCKNQFTGFLNSSAKLIGMESDVI